jgi:hypothetical protein
MKLVKQEKTGSEQVFEGIKKRFGIIHANIDGKP